MSCTAKLHMQLGSQLLSTKYGWPQEELKLEIPVECPDYKGNCESSGIWGYFKTSMGEVRCY